MEFPIFIEIVASSYVTWLQPGYTEEHSANNGKLEMLAYTVYIQS